MSLCAICHASKKGTEKLEELTTGANAVPYSFFGGEITPLIA